MLIFAASGLHAQPVHEQAQTREHSPEVQTYPGPAMELWSVPAPHGFEWIFAYDPTPLTFDDPGFQIQLGNTAKPVRMQPLGDDQMRTIVCELTKPTGEVVTSEPDSDVFYVNHHRKPGDTIEPGKPIFRVNAMLHRYFGELEPGEHTLVVRITTAARLVTDDQTQTLEEDFTISTPPMRFTVIERSIPVHDMTEGNLLGHDGTNHTLTNPFDEPLMVSVLGPIKDGEQSDRVYSLYNTSEKLTDTGWIISGPGGFCGVGMESLDIQPGETVKVYLHGSFERGVIRHIVNTGRRRGRLVRFFTEPKMSEGLVRR
jgi:hypothetical protein